jgi:glycosyltransferase involved in cell wall biosynthesis
MSGGTERVVLNLARCFAESGFKVDLVLSRAEGRLLEAVPKQVRIIELQALQLDRNRFFKLPTSFSSTTSLPKLVSYLQKEQPAALLSAGHYSNEIAIAAKYLARVQTRVVVSEHTILSVQAKRVEQVSSRLAPLAARLLYPWADGIVAVSHSAARDLAQITKIPLERIQTIYNPAIAPELIERSQELVSHPWFVPGELPVILGVGRFVQEKDFPTLIQAFSLVQKVKPSRLVIIGGGRDRQRLESLVKELHLEDRVALLGFSENPYAYMAKAAVFVLSSIWEGLSNVLIEAMAVGTPVVATDCGGPAEILDGGKYGELVPVGDREAMAEAILKVLSGHCKTVDPTWLDRFTLKTATQKYREILKVDI